MNMEDVPAKLEPPTIDAQTDARIPGGPEENLDDWSDKEDQGGKRE